MRSLLLICLLSVAGLTVAEEAVVDPPGRVARLSLVEGEVSMAPAGTEEWAEAILNRPLTSGDRVWVDNGGRAELQVGSATLHVDQGSGVSLVNLDDDVLHLGLTEGSVTIRVLRKRDNESIVIDTPNATVTLLHPGEYHVQVNSAGDQTIVGTRNGDSEVSAGEKSWKVGAYQQGTFDGSGELSASINELGPRTAFQEWANDRNRPSESSVSSRYVSSEVIGYEDLDRHGYWVNEPRYGYVWRPTHVVAGWAPYRFGRWVWVSPWGWNWVDNSPWGFAPFHYGRWANVQNRWCWVPGPRYIRPVYAPALVAWAGSPGVSVGVSFGSGIGWFPLGPREIYVPGYRYSRGYLHNVNVSNTVIVNNTYINNVYYNRNRNFDYRYGRHPGAVTVVDRDRFVGGRPIDGQWSRVPEADLRRWHHDSRPPALAPNRDSVFASRVLGRIPGNAQNNFRGSADQRGNDARNQLAARNAAGRVPFDAERLAIEANGGRPVGRAQLSPDVRPGANRAQLSGDAVHAQRAQPGTEARDVSHNNQDSGTVARPRSSAGGSEVSRSFGDRPVWLQGQPDNSIRTDDDRRRQIPEQRQSEPWGSDSESARRARAGAPPMNSLQQQQSQPRSGGAPNPTLSERAGGATVQQWRGEQRADRAQRAGTSQDRTFGAATQRESAPARSAPPTYQPQTQTQPQYRAPQRQQPAAEPSRSLPPAPKQPASNAENSGRSTRQDNNSRPDSGKSAGPRFQHQQ